jgi:hypothetical protein
VVGDAAVNTGLGAVSDPRLRWDCGHLTTEHPRAEAARCRDARVHRTGDKRSARDIATEAARLVGGDRAVAHGDMSVNFANTAAIWNALLEAKARQQSISTPRLTALDVPNFLEAFKIARRYSGSHNIDDYIDGAGYAACAGEIAEKMSHGD